MNDKCRTAADHQDFYVPLLLPIHAMPRCAKWSRAGHMCRVPLSDPGVTTRHLARCQCSSMNCSFVRRRNVLSAIVRFCSEWHLKMATSRPFLSLGLAARSPPCFCIYRAKNVWRLWCGLAPPILIAPFPFLVSSCIFFDDVSEQDRAEVFSIPWIGSDSDKRKLKVDDTDTNKK